MCHIEMMAGSVRSDWREREGGGGEDKKGLRGEKKKNKTKNNKSGSVHICHVE